jgi:hypothetical protein
MQYIQTRRISRQEACSMFHVPPALIAAAENGSQPDEASMKVFYKSTLPPYLERIEANVKAKLLPMFTASASIRRKQYVKFNLDEKLRGSFEEKAAIMATLAGGPVVSVNEGRARLDLPKTDDPLDDKIYQPTNSIRGGGPQASPQNPTDTPAPRLNPAGTTPGGGTNPDKSIAEEIADWEARREAEHKRAVLMVRVEERAASVIQKHLERQHAASGKQYNDERWTRELLKDLTAGIAPILGIDETYSDSVHDQLENLARSVNAETESRRDDPAAFNGERTREIAESVVHVIDGVER